LERRVAELPTLGVSHIIEFMPKTTSPLKRAITAAKRALGPQRYGLEDRAFVCQMCGHEHFKTGQYIAAVGMHTLVCGECSHVVLFEKMPERIES
jgi:hypothetical protein